MAVLVVNMIPADRSDETNNDTEATVAVNPMNPSELVGPAFTPNPTPARLAWRLSLWGT
jgi:hypothetical protein